MIPRCAPSGPKMDQEGAQTAPRWRFQGTKLANDGAKIAQDGSRWPLRAPRWAQDGPKMGQAGPWVAPRRPKSAPRCSPKRARGPQDGPKRAQDEATAAQHKAEHRNISQECAISKASKNLRKNSVLKAAGLLGGPNTRSRWRQDGLKKGQDELRLT